MWRRSRRVLLSYRRSDTGPIAHRLADYLKQQFGKKNVFIDVDNIPYGTDFRAHIRATIEICDVVLVIIGSSWLGSRGGSNRLMEPNDTLRIEIETAIKVSTIVVPVLVDRVSMPSSKMLPNTISDLVFLNAAPLDTAQDFGIHASRIAEAIRNFPRFSIVKDSKYEAGNHKKLIVCGVLNITRGILQTILCITLTAVAYTFLENNGYIKVEDWSNSFARFITTISVFTLDILFTVFPTGTKDLKLRVVSSSIGHGIVIAFFEILFFLDPEKNTSQALSRFNHFSLVALFLSIRACSYYVCYIAYRAYFLRRLVRP